LRLLCGNSNINFHKKIRPVGAKLFQADRRTDMMHGHLNVTFEIITKVCREHSRFVPLWYTEQHFKLRPTHFLISLGQFIFAVRNLTDKFVGRIETHFVTSATGCAVCCGQATLVGSRQQSRYIVPKTCVYSQSAPEDGKNCRPKHVEQA